MTTELAMATGGGAVQPPVPSAPPAVLTKRQKAAVIVRFLLAKGADISLASLSPPAQEALVRQMAELRHVDQGTLSAVVEEFIAAYEGSGLSFPRALDDALCLLDDALGPEASSRLRRQAGLVGLGDPWARIGGLETETLAELLGAEAIEVAAVVLSKLKVSKAAEVLGTLPGDQARRIAYAMSLTGNIAPLVVQRIGSTLAKQLDAQPERAFAEGPVERVGAILNFSPTATREEVLDGLEKTDSGFASEVRKAIFTFANIPDRVEPRDVPRITREVDPELLVTGLVAAGEVEAEAAAAEFILANLSQRMAGQLREEMEAVGKVKQKDGEVAMTAIVAAIRQLDEAGEIMLVAEED